MRICALFCVVVSVSSWSVQCLAEAVDSFRLPDEDTTGDVSASGNLLDWNEPSDSTDLTSSGLITSNGDLALTPGGAGSSCAQPLGKRDDLFEPDLLLSITIPR